MGNGSRHAYPRPDFLNSPLFELWEKDTGRGWEILFMASIYNCKDWYNTNMVVSRLNTILEEGNDVSMIHGT